MSYSGYRINQIAPIFLIILIYLIVRLVFIIKRKETNWHKETIRFLLIIYVAKLIGTTLFPINIDIGNKLSIFPISYEDRFRPVVVNLNPFDFLGLLHLSTSIFLRNIVGNIVLMVPYTILLAFNFKSMRNWQKGIGFAFFTSLTIELLQLLWQYTMLDFTRKTDINDLICNVIGAVIGYILYHFVLRKVPMLKPFILDKDNQKIYERQVIN